jgi:hypothetical protein
MSVDTFTRTLSFALQPIDHFSRAPVPEELQISLDSREPAVRSPAGGFRHSDGSYRWINVGNGAHTAVVQSKLGHWTSWSPGPLSISLPLTDPATAIGVELWPTPRASVPAGVSAVRGKLEGAGSVAGLRVAIDGTGVASLGRWTKTDADGEFLYLLPGGPWPLSAHGQLDLTAVVTGRTITSTIMLGGATTSGARFLIPPQREVRVRFQLA